MWLLLVLQFVQPLEATQEILRDVHTEEYLRSINESSHKLAEVMGLLNTDGAVLVWAMKPGHDCCQLTACCHADN